MRRGFTLLETLAGVVMLGWLAVALVPLVMHLSRSDEHMTERWRLIELAARWEPPAWPSALGEWEVAGHPGFWWRVVALRAGTRPERSRLPHEQVVAYRWYHVAITQGRGSQAPWIADRLVLIPVADAPLPAPTP